MGIIECTLITLSGKRVKKQDIVEACERVRLEKPERVVEPDDLPHLPVWVRIVSKTGEVVNFVKEILSANPHADVLREVANDNKVPRVVRIFASDLLQKVNK